MNKGNKADAQDKCDRTQQQNKALRILHTALNPPNPVTYAAVPAIVVMLVAVFAFGNQNNPLAYVAYVASAYLLVVVCVRLAKVAPIEAVRSLASKSRFLDELLRDADFRRRESLMLGFIANYAWAVFNLVAGIIDQNIWSITLGAYFLLLATMRSTVFSRMRRGSKCSDGEARAIELGCGILLILSIFILSGIVTLTMVKLGGYSFGKIMSIAYAAFAFYSLAMSIANRVKLRSHENRLVVLNARISLAVTLVSMLALEIALLSAFGAEKDAAVAFVMPILTGGAVAIAITTIGIRVIRDSRRPCAAGDA